MNPTLYAVRDDGAELWDTGEPSPFPGEPGLGYIVDTAGRKFDVRPILSLTARGSWTPADEIKADLGDPETKREYTRDRLGRFSEVPGSGLADFMTDHAKRGEHVDMAGIRIGGSATPDVFRVNHGMRRDEMPQVPNEHKPKFLAEMKAQGVKVEKVKVSPSALHPVQGEIDGAMSGTMLPFKPELTEGNPIMVSNDGYVLDGHHRWAAAVAEEHRTPGGITMTAYRVDLPIDELLKRTAAWNEDADIAARVFGGAKMWLIDADERREAVEAFKNSSAYPEFKRVFHNIQHHGGWIWAGRGSGGDKPKGRHEGGHVPDLAPITAASKPKPGATEARFKEQEARNAGKPDIITVTDPYGEQVQLTKSMSMWHHLEQKPDGSWGFTPERERLHRQIIQDTLRGVPRSDNPTLFMLGGGPAAGKSTMINSGGISVPTTGEKDRSGKPTAREAVLVNADEVKAALPEYHSMGKAGSSFVHEESSWVAKQIQAAALAGKRDVVLDGTGDSKVQKLAAKIQQAREAGYRVEGHYATVPTDVAVARSEKRYQDGLARGETGRHVPEEVVRGTHADVSRTLPQAHDLFDVVNLYDTMDGARLIATGTRGKPLNILDPAAYAAFLAKGNES
jgi:predicted ABC-type ATPase